VALKLLLIDLDRALGSGGGIVVLVASSFGRVLVGWR
jgi:hypothetical protein